MMNSFFPGLISRLNPGQCRIDLHESSITHFHSLRHYFASDCVRLGFDIKSLSELLGHSNVEITLNRYVHSSFDQKREYMNRIKFSVKNTSFAKDCV